MTPTEAFNALDDLVFSTRCRCRKKGSKCAVCAAAAAMIVLRKIAADAERREKVRKLTAPAKP